MARRYVSNKNETVRMFESDFMEALSHVHWITPIVIYVPVICYFLYDAYANSGFGVASIFGLFLLGLLLWTLTEYTMHRFVFHYQPTTEWGQRLHFILHGVHHDYPNDATRLVLPPSVSGPLAIAFYLMYVWTFGERYGEAMFTGLVFGYVCYDTLHYATHHFPMKRGVLLWLKQHHMRHHYHDDHTGYGVSTPLWDYVFGTRQSRPGRSTSDEPRPETTGA